MAGFQNNNLRPSRRRQPLTARRVNQLEQAANRIRSVSGDGRYIAADTVGGGLSIRWIGPPIIAYQRGTSDSAASVGAAAEGSETADTTTWDRDDQGANDGVAMTMITRLVYNDAGDELLYGYARTLTFDSRGMLSTISAETRFTIDTPEEGCVA